MLGTCDPHLQDYLFRVADAGLLYGGASLRKGSIASSTMSSNRSEGECISPKLGIDYLGSVLGHDGLPGHELGRRIGMAKRDFLELQKFGSIRHCRGTGRFKSIKLV